MDKVVKINKSGVTGTITHLDPLLYICCTKECNNNAQCFYWCIDPLSGGEGAICYCNEHRFQVHHTRFNVVKEISTEEFDEWMTVLKVMKS